MIFDETKFTKKIRILLAALLILPNLIILMNNFWDLRTTRLHTTQGDKFLQTANDQPPRSQPNGPSPAAQDPAHCSALFQWSRIVFLQHSKVQYISCKWPTRNNPLQHPAPNSSFGPAASRGPVPFSPPSRPLDPSSLRGPMTNTPSPPSICSLARGV